MLLSLSVLPALFAEICCCPSKQRGDCSFAKPILTGILFHRHLGSWIKVAVFTHPAELQPPRVRDVQSRQQKEAASKASPVKPEAFPPSLHELLSINYLNFCQLSPILFIIFKDTHLCFLVLVHLKYFPT